MSSYIVEADGNPLRTDSEGVALNETDRKNDYACDYTKVHKDYPYRAPLHVVHACSRFDQLYDYDHK